MKYSITSDVINDFDLAAQHNFIKAAGHAKSFFELSINDSTEENNFRVLSDMYYNDVLCNFHYFIYYALTFLRFLLQTTE